MWGRETHENGFVDEEDGGVGFEVDSRGFADYIETFDGYVRLV
jgi:hypothetical protein